MTDQSSLPADAGLAPDRRAFVTGALGLLAVGATASFAPALSAPPAAAAACAVDGVHATFWGLPYVDFTGTAAPCAPVRRAAALVERDFDPHAELFG